MIILGWGKVTKKFIGGVFQRTCSYCNQTTIWQLCIKRTWFTLFFIPIIPYAKTYEATCPSCGSYVELTEEQFEKMKTQLEGANLYETSASNIEDSIKYAGKTETQINYLKHMEELEKNKNNN
jgi:endogenous inhibitor of DNA gyrase (YacG/DUF329 family)